MLAFIIRNCLDYYFFYNHHPLISQNGTLYQTPLTDPPNVLLASKARREGTLEALSTRGWDSCAPPREEGGLCLARAWGECLAALPSLMVLTFHCI